MEPTDLTTRVLIDIRDEIRGTNRRLDHVEESLAERIDETNVRIDNLTRRMVEGEARVATELVEVAGTNRQILGLLRDRFDLRDRVERCEQDIAELKRKVEPR